MRKKSKYRRIAAIPLERELTSEEWVHHIDGDRKNYDLFNLFVTPLSGHAIAHQSLQELMYAFVKAGLVKFNRKKGTYYVADNKLRELLEHPTGESRGQSAAEPTRNRRKVQRLGHGVQTGQ